MFSSHQPRDNHFGRSAVPSYQSFPSKQLKCLSLLPNRYWNRSLLAGKKGTAEATVSYDSSTFNFWGPITQQNPCCKTISPPPIFLKKNYFIFSLPAISEIFYFRIVVGIINIDIVVKHHHLSSRKFSKTYVCFFQYFFTEQTTGLLY